MTEETTPAERKRERDRAYYRQHRVKIINRATAYQKENSAAKNKNNAKWRRNNPAKMNSSVQSWRKNNPEKNMLHAARHRAKRSSLDFDITAEDILIPDVCPVFGFPLIQGKTEKGPSDYSPTLDRIDNNLGYIKGNVIVVSWLANRIKNNATVEQLRMVADFYASLSS